jgi:hypothetical protein
MVMATVKQQQFYDRMRRRTNAARSDTNNPQNDMRRDQNASVTATPPADGWILIAKRSFKADGKQFLCGAQVEPKVLGRNHAHFFAKSRGIHPARRP